MIELTLDEVRRLCGGELEAMPGAARVTGVQIDSRRVAEGDLFVVVGRGGDFRRHAVARGAAAVLVPEDAFRALAALAAAVRERSAAQIVGVTGSTGKTSTKDILAALCRPHARIVAGAAGELAVEPDRAAAIARALEEARPGDVVLIAGKGHEQGQEIAGRMIPFDDRDVARDALRRLGAAA